MDEKTVEPSFGVIVYKVGEGITATHKFIVIFDIFLRKTPRNHPHLTVTVNIKESRKPLQLRLQKAI